MDPHTMRRIGRLMFTLGWIPFAGIFVGMIGMPDGDYAWGELPTITQVSLILVATMFGGSMLLQLGSSLFSGVSNTHLQTEGRLAEAEILDISDTGTTINNDPVVRLHLRVIPGDDLPFEAHTEQLISRVKLPSVQPGNRVAVRYDPETKRVALAKETNPAEATL